MAGRPRIEVELVKVFRAPRVLTFDQLCDRLALSRSTVFRRLHEHGYYSSYNHSGRFLTLAELADFDDRGLWMYRTARFSKHGTLKETVRHFVQSSERGMTHWELAGVLGVRVHNVLRELSEGGTLTRKAIGPNFVYFAPKRALGQAQERRRRESLKEAQKPRPSSRDVITTLLELIKDPRVTREQIVARCQRGGVLLSRQVVDTIFEFYELEKKRAP